MNSQLTWCQSRRFDDGKRNFIKKLKKEEIQKSGWTRHWAKKCASQSYLVNVNTILLLRTKTHRACGCPLSKDLSALFGAFTMKINIGCNKCPKVMFYLNSLIPFFYFFIVRWLRLQFRKADKDRTGALTFKQVRDLLERINIKLSRKYAKDLFNVCTLSKISRIY